MANTGKKSKGADRFQYDDADVGTARAGGRENENDREENLGRVGQLNLYLEMICGKRGTFGVGTEAPRRRSHLVSPGDTLSRRAMKTSATGPRAAAVAGGGSKGSRDAAMRSSIWAGNAGTIPTILARYTPSINS